MITIVGGTYREVCLEPNFNEIFGSGLRAVRLLLENTTDDVKFYTSGNGVVDSVLTEYKAVFPNLTYYKNHGASIVTFKYNFFLDEPKIYDKPNQYELDKINVVEENVICFGMLDATIHIKANKVVYDPQTSDSPVQFDLSSKAQQLIYIVNYNEAKSVSRSNRIEDILNFFFDELRVFALVIKDGPKGAYLYQGKKLVSTVPVYRTNNIFKIGSGDIFTTTFGYYWFNDSEQNLEKCLERATLITASYCESCSYLSLFKSIEKNSFQPLKIDSISLVKKTVYLAGPIFTLSNLILIDKIRDCFLGLGVGVFSPYHDIGLGNDEKIAQLDLKAIENCDAIFAVVDGLDSGTLIELGYAMAIKKKIIGYNKLEDESSLLMLKAADSIFFRDLTTSIYHTIWSL